MSNSKTNEQAFEWLIERALVGSTKEEREAAGLTDVDAQQPDAQQYKQNDYYKNHRRTRIQV